MNTGPRAVGFVVAVALAAMLGPHAFGLVAMALTYLLFVNVFLEQGFASAIIQRTDLRREHLDSAFWMTLGWSIVLGGASVGLSGWWARANNEPDLALVIQVLSIIVPIQGLTIVQQALMQRNMEFKRLAVRSNVGAVLGGLCGIGLAIAGFGVWALVVAELLERSAQVILLWAVSGWRPGARFSRRHARELLGFSVHALVGNLGNFVNRRSDVVLIGLFMGPTVVGLYRLADQFVDGVLSVTANPLQQVSLPHFSRLQDQPTALRRAAISSTRILTLTTVPIMLGLVAVAAYFTPVLGSRWLPATDALRLLALAGIAKGVLYLAMSVLFSVARLRLRTLLIWSLAAVSAGSFVAIGLLLRNASVEHQVLGTAATRALLFTAVFIPLNLLVISRLTGVSLGALAATFRFPVAAGAVGIGAVAALGATGLLDRLPPIAAFLVAGSVGVVTIVGALWLLEPAVRSRGTDLWRRASRRIAPREAHPDATGDLAPSHLGDPPLR